ncbi:hypothetical protein VSDG_08113 [Cytospora chrysosperma]|uniref:Uncharacterized protein n=1 Tax=Cytospora chrysosperma TaxID=252740 RepID=A0A423VFC3_CYTCH|nr:hypothetical protein VSDG_08113 [Valsa sordida]
MGKFSSTLKRNFRVTESPVTTNAAEEDSTQGSSHSSRSTQQSQAAIGTQPEQRQQLAADSLRRRLKADLRPDLPADGLHQVQMAKYNHDDLQRSPLSRPEHYTFGKGAEDIPTPGIQRASGKYNNQNPFTGHKYPYDSQGDERAGPEVGDEFSEVALAFVPGNQRVYTNSGSGPTVTGPASNPTEESGGISGNDGLPVVVANAECELEHPRPSRRSERERIKALCKGEGEDSEDLQGRRRRSEVSGGSSASYHTAPVSISVS